LSVALVASSSPPAAAQVESQERSPLVAGVLQAVLPPLPVGYLYAGNVARGLIPMGVMVVGTSIFLVETVEVLDWTDGEGSGALMKLGFGMTLGAYAFGIFDAANVARNRNARLRSGAALRLTPTPHGMGVGVSIPMR
jgi:hypothetical protein